MAMNFSQRPVFRSTFPDDLLVSCSRINGSKRCHDVAPEKEEAYFDYCNDADDALAHKDILDLLPEDPFGMDLDSTVVACAGWLQDLEDEFVEDSDHQLGSSNDNYPLFTGFNLIPENAMNFQSLPWSMNFDLDFNAAPGIATMLPVVNEARGACVDDVPGSGSGCEELDEFLANRNASVCNEFQYASHVEGEGHDHLLFSGFNLIPNNAVNLYSLPWSTRSDLDMNPTTTDLSTMHPEGRLVDPVPELATSWTGMDEFSADKNGSLFTNASDMDEGGPPEGFYFALLHLGVKDLLAVEGVCKSLQDTVRNDPLLWKTLHVEFPLNQNLTDDSFLNLAARAQGNLQCLSLVECRMITSSTLKHVLENNLNITKLSVAGCSKIGIKGLITSLQAFKDRGGRGVKHLRIGGLFGVKQQHVDTLKLFMDSSIHHYQQQQLQTVQKPHFYSKGNLYLPLEDDRPIDIEVCPRCKHLRMVYDCPAESCKEKQRSPEACRACWVCIARCIQCGRCLTERECEETFSFELICLDCCDMHPLPLDKLQELYHMQKYPLLLQMTN